MKNLRTYFDNFVKLSDEEWKAFELCLTEETVLKKQLILSEGEVCDFTAFIVKGMFRFYRVIGGTDTITGFFFDGDFVTNYRSFLTGRPSDHFIEAMEDAVVHKINLHQLRSLYDKHQAIERLGRLIAEKLYLIVAERLDSFMFASPAERYQSLMERNSQLLQDVPQYMIASYLGVKPETLSRIRKRK